MSVRGKWQQRRSKYVGSNVPHLALPGLAVVVGGGGCVSCAVAVMVNGSKDVCNLS